MRYFKLVTHLTVPRSLLSGVGNLHVRPEPGNTLALGDDACARESRFINGRLRAGDLIEIKESGHSPATCAHTKHVEAVAAREATEAAKDSEPAVKPAKGK
jgi:hypothetical protein